MMSDQSLDITDNLNKKSQLIKLAFLHESSNDYALIISKS